MQQYGSLLKIAIESEIKSQSPEGENKTHWIFSSPSETEIQLTKSYYIIPAETLTRDPSKGPDKGGTCHWYEEPEDVQLDAREEWK